MNDVLTIDLIGDTSSCGPDCPSFIEMWLEWWDDRSRRALAIADCEEYVPRLRRKSRAMVRQADRRYEYRSFAYNDQLDGIYSVNTSRDERQGRPMSASYREQPKPLSDTFHLCSVHRDTWYGSFEKDGTLAGYCRLEKLNEIGILNTILGRAGATGAINGLVAYLAEHSEVRWINYLHMESSTDTLTAFKRRIGFSAVRCKRKSGSASSGVTI